MHTQDQCIAVYTCTCTWYLARTFGNELLNIIITVTKCNHHITTLAHYQAFLQSTYLLVHSAGIGTCRRSNEAAKNYRQGRTRSLYIPHHFLSTAMVAEAMKTLTTNWTGSEVRWGLFHTVRPYIHCMTWLQSNLSFALLRSSITYIKMSDFNLGGKKQQPKCESKQPLHQYSRHETKPNAILPSQSHSFCTIISTL